MQVKAYEIRFEVDQKCPECGCPNKEADEAFEGVEILQLDTIREKGWPKCTNCDTDLDFDFAAEAPPVPERVMCRVLHIHQGGVGHAP